MPAKSKRAAKGKRTAKGKETEPQTHYGRVSLDGKSYDLTLEQNLGLQAVLHKAELDIAKKWDARWANHMKKQTTNKKGLPPNHPLSFTNSGKGRGKDKNAAAVEEACKDDVTTIGLIQQQLNNLKDTMASMVGMGSSGKPAQPSEENNTAKKATSKGQRGEQSLDDLGVDVSVKAELQNVLSLAKADHALAQLAHENPDVPGGFTKEAIKARDMQRERLKKDDEDCVKKEEELAKKRVKIKYQIAELEGQEEVDNQARKIHEAIKRTKILTGAVKLGRPAAKRKEPSARKVKEAEAALQARLDEILAPTTKPSRKRKYTVPPEEDMDAGDDGSDGDDVEYVPEISTVLVNK